MCNGRSEPVDVTGEVTLTRCTDVAYLFMQWWCHDCWFVKVHGPSGYVHLVLGVT